MNPKSLRIGANLSIQLIILTVLFLILEFFRVLSISEYIDLFSLSLVSLILGFIFIPRYYNKNRYFKISISILGLLMLGIIFLNTFLQFPIPFVYERVFFLFTIVILAISIAVNKEIFEKEGKERVKESSSFIQKIKNEGLYTIVVLSLAFILFTINYFSQNNFFFGGEFHSLFATTGILSFGLPQMPSGVYYLRNLPYHYYLSIFGLVLGLSKITFKIAIIIPLGIAFICTYKMIKEFFNKESAILSCLLLLGSPWLLTITTSLTRFYALMISLIIITFYITKKYMETRDIKLFILLIALALFTSTMESIGFAVLFPIMYVVVYDFFNKKTDKKLIIATTILTIIAVIVTLVPKQIIDNELTDYNSQEVDNAQTYELYIKIFSDSLQSLSIESGFLDLIVNNHLFLLIFYFVGLLIFFYQGQKLEKLPLIYYFLGILILLSSLKFLKFQNRIISPFLGMFYLAIGPVIFYYLHSVLRSKEITKKVTRFFLVPILLVFIGLNSAISPMYLSSSLDSIYDISPPSNYINQNIQSGDIIISTLPWSWDNLYLAENLNYTLKTRNYEVPRVMIEISEENYTLLYHKTPVLTDVNEFIEVTQGHQRVWIIEHNDKTNPHNKGKVIDYLENNQDKIVFEDRNLSRVYLFENNESNTFDK